MGEKKVAPSYAAAELQARGHRASHDFAKAADGARSAADIALDEGDSTGWWNMTFLQAENLLDAGDFAASTELARSLFEASLAAASPQHRARALILMANSLRGEGLLEIATSAAASAVGLVDDDADMEIDVHARQALIAAFGESGKLEEAWEECLSLSARISDEMDDQLAGKAYWVIGNVAFLCDKVDEGLHYHELAAETFSPSRNLDVWAKFNKASAAMRLAAEVADAATLRCIERAELATDVVGGNEEEILLLRLNRAHWTYLAGDAGAAIELLDELRGRADQLPPQMAGEIFLLMARAQADTGSKQSARESLLEAADRFDKAGAHQRALQAREMLAPETGPEQE
ncbi:hypothetical protein [Arthrobacter sp. MMS18-M83]|uniref:hypothetical protein n=1 Tax=Arthrobacter sp. MMS18-M83 TaxID=2996261 RepID=UPI00227B4941|nr:hypothetical protein [Arthrobacter sp. MMS18-M83]WAH98981.1 hypothetical protein OW521_09225 [Arthrobacter sp. MMS18-M83]